MLQEKDKILFAETMQLFAKRFHKNGKLDKIDMQSYWFALSDEFEDIGEFQKAAKKVMKTWSYGRMPEPSAFIAAKKEHSDLDIEIIAQKAWESVVYAIEQGVGYTKTAEFEDKLIPAVVELTGGFERLASKSYDELEWIKKEFIKTYKAALQGEISIRANEQRALLEDTKTLQIAADYPVKTQNQKVLTYKEEQNKATKLIANLAKAKRITA
jgi:hypothetical protein